MPQPYLLPEDFGAIGKTKTCAEMGWDQEKVDRKFPDAGADPSWSVDRAAWQQCLVKASATGKRVEPGDNNYYFNGGLWYDGMVLQIETNNVFFNSMNNLKWAFLFRKLKPASRLQAEAMVSNTMISVRGLTLNCQSEQTGFDFNSVKYYKVEQNMVNGAKKAMGFDFCLHGEANLNHAQGCVDGFISGLGIPGDNEMSSNLIRMVQNKCHSCTGIGFGNYYAYEAVFEQNIVEGAGAINIAMLIDFGGKTTANDCHVNIFHFEQVGGANTAIIKANLRHQKLKITSINAHYPGIAVDATSTNGGGIWLDNTIWIAGRNGKKFRSNGTTWRFVGCDGVNEGDDTIWATDLGGSVAKYGQRSAMGYNSYLLDGERWDR